MSDNEMEQLKKQNERMERELKSWGKMLELHGINSDTMSHCISVDKSSKRSVCYLFTHRTSQN